MAYNEQADDLAKRGVSKDEFLSTLKVILGVKSSKQITLVQWKRTRADLKAKGYGKIVKDIIAKVNEAQSDADAKKGNGASDKEASPAPTEADPRF